MKRDELLETMRIFRYFAHLDHDGLYREANAIIAWLERLPAGCELIGVPLDDVREIAKFKDYLTLIAQTEAAGLNQNEAQQYAYPKVYPDDLTNAGKSRQFEAYECKKCNLDGPDNCWNHKAGK